MAGLGGAGQTGGAKVKQTKFFFEKETVEWSRRVLTGAGAYTKHVACFAFL